MKQGMPSGDRYRARSLRQIATDAERRLWAHLRDRRLANFKFRRQQPIGRYIVDFVCFEAQIVVEADGSQHQAQGAYDSMRTEYLASRGYRVLRFWNNDMLARTGIVLDVIHQALMTPHPNPLPQGERE